MNHQAVVPGLKVPSDAIFLAAPLILRDLAEAGIEHPSLELFVDGSGKLKLGAEANLSDEQIKLAVDLVHSQRFETCIKCLKQIDHAKESHNVTIHFCGGLYEEAKKRGLATDAGDCCG